MKLGCLLFPLAVGAVAAATYAGDHGYFAVSTTTTPHPSITISLSSPTVAAPSSQVGIPPEQSAAPAAPSPSPSNSPASPGSGDVAVPAPGQGPSIYVYPAAKPASTDQPAIAVGQWAALQRQPRGGTSSVSGCPFPDVMPGVPACPSPPPPAESGAWAPGECFWAQATIFDDMALDRAAATRLAPNETQYYTYVANKWGGDLKQAQDICGVPLCSSGQSDYTPGSFFTQCSPGHAAVQSADYVWATPLDHDTWQHQVDGLNVGKQSHVYHLTTVPAGTNAALWDQEWIGAYDGLLALWARVQP